jgi:HSP20 family protein
VSATDTGWRVRAELPGLADDDVRVEATADSLQVSVSHKDAAPEGYTRIHRERKDLAFTERFRFRTPIHVEGVEASVKDGVLTIDVPRAPATTPRLIPVTH